MAGLTPSALRRLDECRAAIGLLTRLPVSRRRSPASPADAVWAYPLAGLIVGAVSAAVRLVAADAGVPPLAAAVLALGAACLATGGLHEDGLADTADALSGGWTVERRLEIMRDSRIGAHGALALMLAVLLRVASVASLAPDRGALALLAASVLSRGAMLPVPLFCRPARPDGLGASLADVATARIGIGIALAGMFGFAFGGVGAVVAAGLVSIVGLVVARRRLGGFTGDLLGAVAVAAECAVLVVIASIA